MHVDPAHLGRVHADRAGARIDQPLGHRAHDRMSDRPVLAHHVLVEEHHAGPRPVIVERVGPADHVDDLVGLDRAGPGVHRIGADAGEVVDLHRQDAAVLRHRDLGVDPVVARVDVGQERFQPVGDELHRPLERDREPHRRHLVGIGVDLDPERAADILRHHPHAVLLEPEMEREDALHHVRRLGRVVDRQVAGRRVEIGDQPARLQRHPGMAAEVEGLLDHRVGVGVGRVDVARGVLPLPGEVVAELGVDDRRRGIERGLHVGRGGELLPFDPDQLGGVLGLLAPFGDDGDHRLALPARDLDGERVLGRGLEPFEMGEHADPRIVDAREVLARHHGHHPGRGLGRRGVDGDDAGMGVGAADERGVDHPRQHDVVDEGAPPVRQAPRVGPRHAAADIGVGAVENPAVFGHGRAAGGSKWNTPWIASSTLSPWASSICLAMESGIETSSRSSPSPVITVSCTASMSPTLWNPR